MRCIGPLLRSGVEAIQLIGIIWIDPDHSLYHHRLGLGDNYKELNISSYLSVKNVQVREGGKENSKFKLT